MNREELYEFGPTSEARPSPNAPMPSRHWACAGATGGSDGALRPWGGPQLPVHDRDVRFRRVAAALVGLAVLAGTGCGGGRQDAGWAGDLDALDAGLARGHADVFHTVAPAEWEAEVARLRTVLPELSDVAAALELRRLVARVGDGHTRIVMDGMLSRYPVELETVRDGVAVVAAVPERADLVGARVLTIAGLPVEEVIAAAEPFVSADNPIERRRRALGLVIAPQFLQHALGSDGAPTFHLGGAASEQAMAPITTARWLAELRGPADPYWWERMGSALYVAYDRCVDDPQRPFAEFAAEVFAAAADPAVDRLVVDLRRNPGGDSAVFDPFVARLAGHRLDHPERLVLLIGPRTYSSAVLNAVALDTATAATLVGQETGGAVNGYGEVGSFTLPSSGLVVEHSTRYFDVVPGVGATLAPDVEIVPSSGDVAAGRDPALDWALGAGS